MRLFLCVVLVFLPFTLKADPMYDEEYQTCSDRSTSDIVECVAQLTKTWDAYLNESYRALKQRSDDEQNDALTVAQRLWIAYRDANCTFYATGQGSITRIQAAACLHAMTKSRACELHRVRHGGPVPPGPCD